MKKKLFIIIPMVIVIFIIFTLFNNGNKKSVINQSEYSSQYSKLAVNLLRSKANDKSITNYEDGKKSEMYAFHHEQTYQLPENTDYRYIGDSPNNYVYFNCSDINDISTCEIWRIIGVFDFELGNGKFEQRVKLVRGNLLPDKMAWDSNNSNNWNNSTIKEFLNNTYYNRAGNAETYGLKESARNMIADSIFYLGYGDINTGVPEDLYRWERGNVVYNNGNRYWIGKVGLMHPSDNYFTYAYSFNNECSLSPSRCVLESEANKSWIFNSNIIDGGDGKNTLWLISSTNEGVFDINYYGYMSSDYDSNQSLGCRPVVYLKPDIIISSGDGSEDNPYMLMQKSDYLNQSFDYKIGDEVYYNNELYHVIENSKEDSDYVVAFKDIPLIEKYMLQNDINQIGFLPFDYNNNCYYKSLINNDKSNCTNNFNKSYIKNFLDIWSDNEFSSDDLVEADGYKVRLITQNELFSALKFTNQMQGTSEITKVTDETPDFIKNRDFYCWSMDKSEDDDKFISFGNYINNNEVYTSLCVDPIINLKKSKLGNNTEYHIGDEIKYKEIDYYVIKDSPSNIDYITVLRKEPLSNEQIQKYSNLRVNLNNIGKNAYKNSYSSIISYETSDVRKIVDFWIEKNFDEDDLKEINGFKGRLISVDELLENFSFEYYSYILSNSTFYNQLKKSENTPEWMYNYAYWTETSSEDNNSNIFIVTRSGEVVSKNMTLLYSIRPIVYLKKSSIGKISSKYEEEISTVLDDKKDEKTCTPKYKKESVTNYHTYNVGDEINYKNELYHVIRTSDSKTNYVTVLKDEALNNKNDNYSLLESFQDYVTKDFTLHDAKGNVNYDNSALCDNENDCKKTYDTSNIKQIVDNWVQFEIGEDNLISVNGYKARIISINELVSNFSFEETGDADSPYKCTTNTPAWIRNSSHWINGDDENNANKYFLDGYCNLKLNNSSISETIRPVINLKKIVLGNQQEYSIGDKVLFRNNDYYVIENSDSSKDYIVLLKDEQLKSKQIARYSNSTYDSLYEEFFNSPFLEHYYYDENCKNDLNKEECKNDYDSSKVKESIDIWIKEKDIEKDLIEVEGYKARLLNSFDLFENLNYTDDRYIESFGDLNLYYVNQNIPEWLYSPNIKYWTMISSTKDILNRYNFDVKKSSVYVILENGDLGSQYKKSNGSINNIYVYEMYAIRPVLNLNKCVLDGGCITEEIEIYNGCLEDDGISVVDVPSTLNSISKVLLTISLILIISGSSYIIYNYYNSRKERK